MLAADCKHKSCRGSSPALPSFPFPASLDYRIQHFLLLSHKDPHSFRKTAAALQGQIPPAGQHPHQPHNALQALHPKRPNLSTLKKYIYIISIWKVGINMLRGESNQEEGLPRLTWTPRVLESQRWWHFRVMLALSSPSHKMDPFDSAGVALLPCNQLAIHKPDSKLIKVGTLCWLHRQSCMRPHVCEHLAKGLL